MMTNKRKILAILNTNIQKNIIPMLRSLARISWDTGVPLVGKGYSFPFITNFLIKVANQAKH